MNRNSTAPTVAKTSIGAFSMLWYRDGRHQRAAEIPDAIAPGRHGVAARHQLGEAIAHASVDRHQATENDAEDRHREQRLAECVISWLHLLGMPCRYHSGERSARSGAPSPKACVCRATCRFVSPLDHAIQGIDCERSCASLAAQRRSRRGLRAPRNSRRRYETADWRQPAESRSARRAGGLLGRPRIAVGGTTCTSGSATPSTSRGIPVAI